MAKPIINKIKPFDALNDNIISFNASGIQVQYNQLIIKNAETLSVVYNKTIESMRLEHVIPANTLVNGVKYKAEIKCFSRDKVQQTEWSDSVLFLCLKTPTFYFNGLSSQTSTKVETSSLNVELIYSQENGERLTDFKYYLYDDTGKNVIDSSTHYFSYVNNNRYLFKMLTNGVSYNIRCIGVTENGIEIDTGLNPIYVSFINASSYSIIVAESNNDKGIVDYYTNLVIANPNREDYQYVDGTYIDLTNDTIEYEQGFLLLNKYSFMVKLKNAKYGKIIELVSANKNVLIECIETETNNKCRYKLTATDTNDYKYIIYTEEINKDNQDITMWIKYVDGLYDMQFV